MASVDLSDLIDSLKREVSAPGLTQLPNATDADYLGNLQDGFWEMILDGVIDAAVYTEADGIVSAVDSTNTTAFPKDLQQLTVFYAGFRIVRNQMRDIKTVFRSKAGPVEFETQQAASVLKAILDHLTAQKSFILRRLSDQGITSSYVIDQVIARDESLYYGDTYWVSGNGRSYGGGFY